MHCSQVLTNYRVFGNKVSSMISSLEGRLTGGGDLLTKELKFGLWGILHKTLKMYYKVHSPVGGGGGGGGGASTVPPLLK